MSDLLNTTIEILEVSDKKGQYGLIKKLKGKNIETGKTNLYTVYDRKQDGSTSMAWEQLLDLELSVGDTVQVGYAEKSGTMDDGKPYTSRIVRNFNKDVGEGVKRYQSSQSSNTPRSEASNSLQGQSRNFEQEAYVKCCSIWAAAHMQNGADKFVVINNLNGGAYWELFQAIKADGEKRFSPLRQAIQRNNPDFLNDVPTIEQDEPPIEAYSDDELAKAVPW